MKKLIALGLLCITSIAAAYDLRIKNETNEVLRVAIMYVLCPSQIILLNPNQDETIKTGICCLRGIKIAIFGKPSSVKSITVDLGSSCKSNHFVIVPIYRNNQLVEIKADRI